MNKADSLIIIAENEEKVYNAGQTKGYRVGRREGEQTGIAHGKELGKAEGIEIGKAEGIEIGKVQGYADGYEVGKTDGQEIGIAQGYSDGYTVGQTEGRAEGIVEGTDQFWNVVTNNGTRTAYNAAFAYWNSEYIHPNRQIIPTSSNSANQTFYLCKNLKKMESAYFDFSQKAKGTSSSHGFYFTFYHCEALEEIEDIGIQPQFSMSSVFNGCSKLHTIAKIRVDEETTFSDAFYYCSALINITFEGTIGKTLGFPQSKKLSKDSIVNIITNLSATVTGQSLTLSKTAVNNAFGIDVTNESTFPEGSEYYILRHSKDNWSILYQ